MEKFIKDGKVAVLYTPGYGAGWYSWNTEYKELLFHPEIVKLVLEGRCSEVTEEFVKKLLGNDADVYLGGASDFKIKWLDEGTPFRIDEYDGFESVVTENELVLVA